MSMRHLIAVASLSTLSACADEELLAIPGSLSGVLCDQETGWPLAETRVSVKVDEARGEAFTKADGTFQIEGVPLGSGTLHVYLEGSDRLIDVDVTEEESWFDDPACRGLPGEPGTGGIRGQVCNRHTGELVSAASVQLVLGEEETLDVVTDDSGRFVFDAVPVGDHVMIIQADGYSQSILVEVEDGVVAEVSLGECTAPGLNEGFLTGHLCDAANDGPLVGADVLAFLSDGTTLSERTDLDGNFLVGPMPVGAVLVRVLREPDVNLSWDAEVLAGQDVVVVNDETCPGFVPPPPPDGEPGTITGNVCFPDGQGQVGGALAWIELPDGSRITATSDAAGNFVLTDVPPGEHVVHVRAGVFETAHTVVVEEGGSVTIPTEDCALDEDTDIAVVSGLYDDVRTVLIDVGVPPASITDYDSFSWVSGLFEDYETLSSYDLVFINCGADESQFLASPQAQANMRRYVNEGGSLYASDWAYNFIEVAFPEHIDFYGDDLTRDSAKTGEVQTYSGTITDAALASALGTTVVSLNYPLPSWAIVQGASSDVRVFIRGGATTSSFETLSNVPHTMSFNVGLGKVTYSSFHQEPGINLQQEQILQLLMFML